MIVDMRIYTMVPGRLQAFLSQYKSEGYPIHVRHFGKPLGYFTTEIGTLNQVVHLWCFEDLADRERRRMALEADPDWIAYRRKIAPAGNILHQKNKILRSVSFSPV